MWNFTWYRDKACIWSEEFRIGCVTPIRCKRLQHLWIFVFNLQRYKQLLTGQLVVCCAVRLWKWELRNVYSCSSIAIHETQFTNRVSSARGRPDLRSLQFNRSIDFRPEWVSIPTHQNASLLQFCRQKYNITPDSRMWFQAGFGLRPNPFDSETRRKVKACKPFYLTSAFFPEVQGLTAVWISAISRLNDSRRRLSRGESSRSLN